MHAVVTVVGAGVAGLTTALALSERGVGVRLLARERSPHTTSDVPAALWYPFKAEPRERVVAWAGTTYRRLHEIARDDQSGVCWRTGVEVFRWKAPEPWWRDAVPGYRRATADEIPAGFVDGYAFEAPIVETPLYLPWLERRLHAAGVEVETAEITDLGMLCARDGVVVNCTGLGARTLAGDPGVFPSRGQLVHVEPLPLERFLLDEAIADRITYVVPRADAVVLGGTVQDGSESLVPDARETASILERALALEPRLRGAAVRRVTVGLRPCRSRVRVEREDLGSGCTAVHNYGHGGAGFTLSWGCAEEAADLVCLTLGIGNQSRNRR